jgi:hypothetical protein
MSSPPVLRVWADSLSSGTGRGLTKIGTFASSAAPADSQSCVEIHRVSHRSRGMARHEAAEAVDIRFWTPMCLTKAATAEGQSKDG